MSTIYNIKIRKGKQAKPTQVHEDKRKYDNKFAVNPSKEDMMFYSAIERYSGIPVEMCIEFNKQFLRLKKES